MTIKMTGRKTTIVQWFPKKSQNALSTSTPRPTAVTSTEGSRFATFSRRRICRGGPDGSAGTRGLDGRRALSDWQQRVSETLGQATRSNAAVVMADCRPDQSTVTGWSGPHGY